MMLAIIGFVVLLVVAIVFGFFTLALAQVGFALANRPSLIAACVTAIISVVFFHVAFNNAPFHIIWSL